jgi:hypothetical protein
MQKIIDEILNKKSVSIVGLAKNTGKTETLNYFLQRLNQSGKTIAVTSIGLDGEQTDQIFGTKKPEITIYKGMIFNTTEKFFEQKTFNAKILNISKLKTELGRIVTAKAIETGKIILSGAVDTQTLKKIIAQNAALGADITIVDGATSRLSLASPAVTDALILATGAAFCADIEQLVKKTKFVCNLINLNEFMCDASDKIFNSTELFTLFNGELHNLGVKSSLMISDISTENLKKTGQSRNLFALGIVSDNLLNFLRLNIDLQNFMLVSNDFTKIFVSPQTYLNFTRKGGKIEVLHRTKLLAVTVNPVSPEGIVLNSELLQEKLRKNIDAAVFDIKKIQ